MSACVKKDTPNFPVVPIRPHHFYDEEIRCGEYTYIVPRLALLADKLVPFDVPVAAIDTTEFPWETSMNLTDFIRHVKRVQDADLDVPVWYSPNGAMINGYHRLCKAILEGKNTVRAVRFDKMPSPDRIEEV